MKQETEKWIKAGSILAVDPKEKVLCPVCQKENLEVEDIRSDTNPDMLERYLFCSACGAKNILRLRRPLTA